MKVGDKLYCYDVDGRLDITIGNIYTIKEFEFYGDNLAIDLCIIDDVGDHQYYNIQHKSNIHYFGLYFYTEKEVRRIKLNRLLLV